MSINASIYSKATNNKLQSLDELIEQKSGTGYYQIVALITVVFIDFNDGAEQILMSLLIPILTKEWQLSKFEVQSLASIFYLGMVIGSLLSGKIADKHGRRGCIMFSCLLQFFTAISFPLMSGPILAMILRFIYGFVYGFSIPLTTTMVSEVTQQRHRGRFLVIVNFFVTVGKMYAFLLAYIFLGDLTQGNWRMMMVTSSFTSLIVFFASKYFLFESPRFLIASGRYQEGLQVVDEIIHLNQTKTPRLVQRVFGPIPQTPSYPEDMVAEGMKQQGMAIFLNWMPFRLRIGLNRHSIRILRIYFGQIIILPFVLGNQKSSILNYFLTVLGEVPSIFVSLLIIEIQFFGRKNTMAASFFMTSILSYICYNQFNNNQVFIPANSAMRFFMKECWAMIYPYTSETYNTLQRAIGFGTAAAIGRIGSTLSPYLLVPLFYQGDSLPWLSFIVAGLIGSIACITLPFDTTGRNLDIEEKKEIELQSQENEIQMIRQELKTKLINSKHNN